MSLSPEEQFMSRCITLARNGATTTAPNPMVGAVIVYQGQIIGEGYHHRCGEPHAEVNAVNDAISRGNHDKLKDSTIYVSLEPCCHYGKTPPCADLIIRHSIPRVVVGSRDSNAKVNGGGIKKLQDAGIEVKVGVLEQECRHLNRKFFFFQENHRPFITLKWAQTADHIIGASDERLVISDSYTQMLCHKLRAEHQGIVVGRTTWQTDHPSLNVRMWEGRNPQIFVLSDSLKQSPFVSLSDLLSSGIQSLLVEGGRKTLEYLIDHNLWEECQIETNLSMCAGSGPGKVPSPVLHDAVLLSQHTYGDHLIQTFGRMK